ncbi:MAG TPA: hypothetical protein VN363_07995 [Anaerolineales bacterium]|nr:hypothetical protein [Anaerolineales bacterium]
MMSLLLPRHLTKWIICLSLAGLASACAPVSQPTVELPPEGTLPSIETPARQKDPLQTSVASLESSPIQIAVQTEVSVKPSSTGASPTSLAAGGTVSIPAANNTPASPTPPAVLAAITPRPPAEPIFGIELHDISEAGGLGLLTGAGGHWVRRNALKWSEVEYLPGQRSWQNLSRLEAELEAASAAGLQTILIVRSTPHFARQSASSACGPVASEYFEAFADFMAEAVSRYSQPPYNVRYWELGNEPDVDPSLVSSDSVFGCWGDQSDPDYGGQHYGEMLKVVYPQVKAANPDAQLLIGGLLLDCDPDNPPETTPGSGKQKDCSSSRFLQGILEAGGGAYFDAVSFHAYDYYAGELGLYGNSNWHSAWNTTGPALYAKTQFLTALLARYGWGDKPLLNTEVALICASSPGVCASEEFMLTKAYYTAQANASALAAGLTANLWYSLQGWRDTGLVGSGMTPNIAYTAYAASLERLSEAAYAGRLQPEDGLMGIAYDRQGTPGWIVWAWDGAAHSLALPQTPARVFDVFGEPVEAASPLEIGVAPVYLEWQP